MPDVHEVREDVADYLGETQAVDHGIGILFETLKSYGHLDNTLIVISGDHGIPGIPRAKCNLYDFGCDVALAAFWLNKIKPGRIVTDFVNLMDLGPTFCDVAKIKIPTSMTAKSLLPILISKKSGRIDNSRDFVVTGRERHVDSAREGFLPYPQRAIRVEDYIYILNFEPDRWPAGDPKGLEDKDPKEYDYNTLSFDTINSPFSDMDASPTKAWLITHRDENDIEPMYQLAFGKRPREELYDLKLDPDYLNNLANDRSYSKIKSRLNERLLSILKTNNDPRLIESPPRFENPPYAGKLSKFQK